ncbi:MAG: non-hydrolyzing UDP-N-acetylglucosamine 2-epimerase [Syntrophobacteraceae bacterium]
MHAKMPNILSIFGTRPEAIKMAPILNKLARHPDRFQSRVCVTAQHREMLDQVLAAFSIRPDYDLDIMRPGQDLFQITASVLQGLKEVIEDAAPNLVLVHGDTTTTMAASLASFYCGAKVGHIEAGLRTRNKFAPYPEEMNRRITGVIADFHFAPTPGARANLVEEKVDPATIFVTGNTVIDALFSVVAKMEDDVDLRESLAARFSFLTPGKKLVLVTGHRRENFGEGFRNICAALAKLAGMHPEIEILYPVHMNPNVREAVMRILGGAGRSNIHLIEPVDYLPFVYLMNRAYLILTDSGGIQEEAPSLRKPVLVMRNTTERPEGVAAGSIRMVGTDVERICSSISDLISDPAAYRSMTTAPNPYGDGKASERIVSILGEIL